MAERPGVMIYDDVAPALDMMDDSEAGQLFKAILKYAKNGVVPEFQGMAAVAWAFLRPKIDRDAEAYEEKRKKKEYAAFCSHLGKEADKPSFEEWKQQTQADAGECMQMLPTTTTTTTPTPTTTGTTDSTSTPSPAATTTPAAGGTGKGVRGETEGDTNTLRNAALEKLEGYRRGG